MASWATGTRTCFLTEVLALGCLSLASCHGPHRSDGERLARTYCAACHAFPEPQLLDKETWEASVITLLETDQAHERIFAGEAGSNRLLIFDWNRDLISTVTLSSPPTDLIAHKERVLVLESGILHPNDQPRGRLVQYDFAGDDSPSIRQNPDRLAIQAGLCRAIRL